MPPLTAAAAFQAGGTPHLGGCRSVVWTQRGSESALCPSELRARLVSVHMDGSFRRCLHLALQ